MLTFHNGINHGAFFQAWSLQHYLEKNGFNVEIINFQDPLHLASERASLVFGTRSQQAFLNLAKVRNFRADHERLRLSSKQRVFFPKNVRKTAKKYDFVIVGSDVIWNHKEKRLGNLSLFFGLGLNPKVGLVAYAASMGPSAASKLPDGLAEAIGKFRAISVRDRSTQNVLAQKGINSEIVIDPSALVDCNEFSDMSIPNLPTRYLLVYCAPLSAKAKEQIIEYSRERDMEIVTVGYPQRNLGLNYTHLGPSGWIALFRRSVCVVTNTFHGTMFAVNLNKHFVTIARPEIEIKAQELLAELEMEDRYSVESEILSALQKPIDWKNPNQVLSRLRSKSAEFLSRSLEI